MSKRFPRRRNLAGDQFVPPSGSGVQLSLL